MENSYLDDIEKQEEELFNELGDHENSYLDERAYFIRCDLAKHKARQQLAVSADSPFSREPSAGDWNSEQKRVKEERATLLREETNRIRHQLDLVKNRLNDLKSQNNGQDNNKSGGANVNKSETIEKTESSEQQNVTKFSQETKCKTVCSKQRVNNVRSHLDPKFRPLTGKTDCPNCTCDRRTSVCGQCISLPPLEFAPTKHQASKRSTYDDDRPIRPAKGRTLATVEVVDDKVVPNKVYTISKALNEKRTKLAQAIDELQLMMDQVKGSSERLSKERKLVQQYKDQWKFGPSIGGPMASSRDRLGSVQQRRCYESRLDPSLSRDLKSVSNFNHIESAMKLRQYGPSKYSSKSKKISTSGVTTTRSKSLESLTRAMGAKNTSSKETANFHNGKSSSEADLSTVAKSKSLCNSDKQLLEIDENEVEEEDQLEMQANELDSRPTSPLAENHQREKTQVGNEVTASDKVQKMTWIPVFGETEIKTIKRTSPTRRKIQIMSGEESNRSPVTSKTISNKNQSAQRQVPTNQNLASQKPRSGYAQTKPIACNRINSNNGGNRVLNEASRKLRFASGLLEQEKRDSSDRNQLIVEKTKPAPKPRQTVNNSSSSTDLPKTVANNQPENVSVDNGKICTPHKQTIDAEVADSNKEIARLEEMVNEQQKLLSRLIQTQERQMVVSPVSIHYPNACCQSAAKGKNMTGNTTNRVTVQNRSLISSMKDRLNKTRLRLARTLEAEREKHQRLKLKVDSSLRKQSDLENENELLKQSLSKCIDTCLKDISNTFEMLNATLTDSINKQRQPDEEDETRSVAGSSHMLPDAAKLIADNRHIQLMKNHIETIEGQRRGIFEELSREKQRSGQLELQLKENQAELNKLLEAKHQLESRLMLAGNDDPASQMSTTNTCSLSSNANTTDCQPSTSKQVGNDVSEADKLASSDTELNDTYNSVELYRRYIQSMSPDIESIKRERKMILSEFDNIKKMLADLDK